MPILLTWLATIVLSKAMNYVTIGRIFRDIYSNGYKINIKNFIEMSKQINNNSKIRQYIMFLNIYDAINMGVSYINNPNEILNLFFVNDSLDEMDNEEKEAYDKNPNFLRAMHISRVSEAKKEIELEKKDPIKEAIKVLFEDKGRTSFTLIYKNVNKKIKVTNINVRTDVMANINNCNYTSFISSELKGIKKIVNYPIKKERLIKYLYRLNRSEKINIIEERINILEEEKALEGNNKKLNRGNYIVSDYMYDSPKSVSNYIDSMLEENKEENGASLSLKRRNNYE